MFAIEAFPNPVRDRLNITIHGAIEGRGTISVSGITGSTVLQLNVIRNQLTLDLSNQPAGTYFIKYSDNNRTQVIKITKQ